MTTLPVGGPTVAPHSLESLIVACGYLQHSALLFAEDINDDLALIRSGFCPRHQVQLDALGDMRVSQEVHEEVDALLQDSHTLRFALHEMLMQFGPAVCNDPLARVILQGVRSLGDWHQVCRSLADLGRGPVRVAA
ncbi:hypothetical protein LQR31_04260 [Chromobacterium vaccinii]|uniref:Uncharacterized protein n=4 Tax=Chromobacteriaceae TaxID=1499392 RepID=A0ABV0FAU3_9NEIS|nr:MULTISPECIES: hypothetical protein [Chromobacteriaceae]AVG15271.1 hypothetical protein CFN79_05020 [Chromobacterium vaccinii]ERD99093.1 hypothetical protein O166_17990 [Pseudogulbenkiania ferrooxidans EGD-HP2]MBX9295988.1 hypothetical protein [Chromobacterium vaccinii]MBX9348397.1 hypothetical protein [Chromobacterium vaccinii]MBX9356629.1 hypothetical protein [Chromobacterium vaccinii]